MYRICDCNGYCILRGAESLLLCAWSRSSVCCAPEARSSQGESRRSDDFWLFAGRLRCSPRSRNQVRSDTSSVSCVLCHQTIPRCGFWPYRGLQNRALQIPVTLLTALLAAPSWCVLFQTTRMEIRGSAAMPLIP